MNYPINQENSSKYHSDKSSGLVLVMVCVYMFLTIERPWESIRYLHNVPIERVFAIVMIVAAFMLGRFKVVNSPANKWVYGLLAMHFMLAPFAFSPDYAVDQGVEYAKMVVLYLLLLSVVDDEKTLNILVKVYVFSMMFYVLHSLWEYHNGRLDFKMGITRMLGVGISYSDPNAFGASVVLSLPFVHALLQSGTTTNLIRACSFLYFISAVICVVLTGSRSAFVALVVLIIIWAISQKGKNKILMLVTVFFAISASWSIMPNEKQDRIRTLWDKNVGEAGAHMSAEGRRLGWKASWRMFKQQPLTGVGAGGKNYIGYRITHAEVDDGEPAAFESHVLYGEVLAEFGVVGAILFCGLIISTWRCCMISRKRLLTLNLNSSFSYHLGGSVIIGLILLLLLGIGGHNFYRPLWLWLAAWAGALFNNTLLLAQKE